MRTMSRSWATLLILLCIFTARASARADDKQQVERIQPADPKVMVSVCLNSGNLNVQSWDRKEVRARISDGVPIEINRNRSDNNRPASELRIVSGANASSCIPFGDLELTVPRTAGLKLLTRDADITVTEAGRVDATSQSGSVWISKVNGEARVNTIGGDISVENSAGLISLHTIGGSIVARQIAPLVGTDQFEGVSVSGDATLNSVTLSKVRVQTVGGSINYVGPLVHSGQYNFQNLSGRVTLELPANASFRINATLGMSQLSGDFPLKSVNNNSVERFPGKHGIHRVEAIAGSGEASINVTSFTGPLQIDKLAASGAR